LHNYAILSGKQTYVHDIMAVYDEATATQNNGYRIITWCKRQIYE